jgi:AraC-like DNA-binding protein
MIHPDLLRRLCRARALLREWSDGPRSVRSVARECGISAFHFIRLFKAMFGETPHRFRSRAQIEKAKHLLILTGLPVTEVCMAVGFSSVGSFSSLFTRRVGMSPSDFQRHHRPSGRPPQLPPTLIPGMLVFVGQYFGAKKSNFREAPTSWNR